VPSSASSHTPACPVCRARFRSERTCSRCGADLTRLMLLIVRAQRLRERAAAELGRGQIQVALAHSERAQSLHATAFGARQRKLIRLLLE